MFHEGDMDAALRPHPIPGNESHEEKTFKEILKFRDDPVLRRAIKLRAALDDCDLQDTIVAVLRKGLATEIKEVQERGLVTEPTSQADEVKKQSRKNKVDRSGTED